MACGSIETFDPLDKLDRLRQEKKDNIDSPTRFSAHLTVALQRTVILLRKYSRRVITEDRVQRMLSVYQQHPFTPTRIFSEEYDCSLQLSVLHAKSAMWSRKHSVCSAVSGASKCDEELANGIQLYPFAIALRVRVLQIVCGIGGLVVGAVGWLEERQKPELGLGVPAGAITVIAAATSVYFSRGFGGWVSARSRSTRTWGAPWRALGPSPCAAVPLTLLWTAAVAAHIAMLTFCIRSLMNIGCASTTCIGVAGAQLAVSVTTVAAAMFMLQLDLRYDASLSPPPRQSDTHICTAVSMVPLTSVAITSGNSGDGGTDPGSSPLNKDKEPQLPSDVVT